jgi:heme o synthase
MSALRDYVAISKPRIITLLLVVAWAAMFVSAGGLPPLVPFLAVTVAGIASTASSGAFNHVLERDRDSRMGRTADRPVAQGRLSVRNALIYAGLMALVAVAALAVTGAWLATLLVVGAIAYYVVVYTILLKPNTPQNIVIGGFAGSFPALIGWAALEDSVLAWPVWVLALLVFLWTPAHFWALALLYRDDYAAADYPMYPNVKGDGPTRRLILVYSILTAALSLSLVWPLASASYIYLGAAAVLGAALVVRAARLIRVHEASHYRAFFFFTIQYLGLLLMALMLDRVVPLPALPF